MHKFQLKRPGFVLHHLSVSRKWRRQLAKKFPVKKGVKNYTKDQVFLTELRWIFLTSPLKWSSRTKNSGKNFPLWSPGYCTDFPEAPLQKGQPVSQFSQKLLFIRASSQRGKYNYPILLFCNERKAALNFISRGGTFDCQAGRLGISTPKLLLPEQGGVNCSRFAVTDRWIVLRSCWMQQLACQVGSVGIVEFAFTIGISKFNNYSFNFNESTNIASPASIRSSTQFTMCQLSSGAPKFSPSIIYD